MKDGRGNPDEEENIPLVVPDLDPEPPPPDPEDIARRARFRRVLARSLAFGLLAVAAVVYVFVVESRDPSPGPLAASHGVDAELDRPGRCRDCHGEAGRSMDQACLACHGDIGRQLADARGFHGTLEKAAACGTCHLDHHGKDAPLVGDRGFQLAGFAGLAQYRHEKLDFRLTGVHAEPGCKRCHLLSTVRSLKTGEKRFLGLDQACSACHKDVHQGAYGPDCAACHGQEKPFPLVAAFAHGERFPLAGGHAGLACLRCHPAGTATAVGALLSSKPAETRTCADCHASPHRKPGLEAVGRLLGMSTSRSCAVCHPAAHDTFRSSTLKPDAHAAFGFPLEAPHKDVACAACHAPERPRFEQRYPGRKPDDCAACHRDPHEGQFEVGIFKGQGCLACHGKTAFAPPAFDAARHALTRFPLTGSHARAACAACHKKPEGRPEAARVFRGTPDSCKACHKDPHEGRFEIGAFKGKDCSACHSVDAFAPARFGLREHELAGFPLKGAHATTACAGCHKKPEGKPDAPRVLAGTPRSCAECHGDPHRGQFAAGPFKGKDCAECHAEERFVPSLFAPELHRRTSFPLTGAHDAIACAACHKKPANDPKAAAVFHGTPGRCADCHRDVHGGLFDRFAPAAAAEGCARCHTTQRFDRVPPDRFDHALTGHPLQGPHAKLACASCHERRRTPDPSGRTFGKAAGASCQNCHRDPHAGQFGPTRGVDCARCHAPSAPRFKDVAFDHDRDSRFKLDAVHAKLACAECHRPDAVGGGLQAVRYKPLGVRCVDCHDPRDPRKREKK